MSSILIIGDSHVDGTAFGIKLESKLKALGHKVTRAGVGATSATQWLSGKACRPKKDKCVSVESLPKGVDLLLISLGTNDAANAGAAKKDPAAAGVKIAGQMKELAQLFGAARTIWIGPPWQRGGKYYSQANMDALYDAAPQSGLELFDSRPSTKDGVIAGSGDGIHPGQKTADQWAQAVVDYLAKDTQVGPTVQTAGVGVAVAVALAIAAFLFLRRRA